MYRFEEDFADEPEGLDIELDSDPEDFGDEDFDSI
jgi:hypothetical protein